MIICLKRCIEVEKPYNQTIQSNNNQELVDLTLQRKTRERLRIWSFVEASSLLITPSIGRHWIPSPKYAIGFLKKTDMLLGYRGNLTINDPIIAEDFGGEDILWGVRLKIREAIKVLEEGDRKKAINMVYNIRNILFDHSIQKFTECLLCSDDPMKGISTTPKQIELEKTGKLRLIRRGEK